MLAALHNAPTSSAVAAGRLEGLVPSACGASFEATQYVLCAVNLLTGLLQVICILQVLLLIIGLIIGIGRAECEVSIHGGADVEINCSDSTYTPLMYFRQ